MEQVGRGKRRNERERRAKRMKDEAKREGGNVKDELAEEQQKQEE